MFKTFLKIAGCHIWRTKLYACINICGLAAGMACVLLATLYLADERSFDNFHEQNLHLYRITTRLAEGGKVTVSGGTGQVQGPAFQSQIPEIQHYARIMGGDIYGNVRHADKVLKLQMLFVDSSFFKVFSFKMLQGNPDKALLDVNSVVITEKTARKFFNRIDVVGKLMEMSADPSAMRIGKPLVVSGVVKDPPANSSVQFDILFPFQFLQVSFEDTSWLNAYLGTFLVLKQNADRESVIRKFDHIGKINSKKQILAYQKDHGTKPVISYGLQAITDIHFNAQEIRDQNGESGIVNGSRQMYSIVFLAVAYFILFMASINFINISIAASVRRAKEIGIRKVTGSNRSEIFMQFIGESALISFVAFILALALMLLLLPVFNQLAGKQIDWQQIFQFKLLGWFLLILSLNTLLSGFYPAYLLSGFNPVEVLYRKQQLTGHRYSGRILVTFQFVTALILSIASLVFYQQMHFIYSKNLGYNPDEVLKIDISGVRDIHSIRQQFESELGSNPSIRQIALTGNFGRRETLIENRKFQSYYRTIEAGYLKMLEMKLKTGRNFLPKFPSDKKFAVLVNEAFVKTSGLQDPVGKVIMPDSYFGKEGFTIVGVVRDFHYTSLRERIEPLVMPMSDQFGGSELLIKIDRNNRTKVLAEIQNTFRKIVPDAAFHYTFLDDRNAGYVQEKRWQSIIGYATAVSVFICLLGLFGLAHLAMFQRKKETGIRVVLGATAMEIVILFSKDFIRIIIAALLIACPLGYFVMNLWLADFAYRIAFPWWTLPFSGLVAIVVTMLTVGSQGARAAAVNPVLSLRSE